MSGLRTALLLLAAVPFALDGGSAFEVRQSGPGAHVMTPEEAVCRYLRCMGKKDRAGMNAVTAEPYRGAEAALDGLKRVELLGCAREAGACTAPDDGYGAPYERALVNAAFRIEYENGGGAGLDNGEYHWRFHLVRQGPDEGWKILMSGE